MKLSGVVTLVGLLMGVLPCHAWSQTELISLAHEAINSEVTGKAPPSPSGNDNVAPVFVTIEKNGRVLGCRGSLLPRESSLQREVVRCAQSAAQHDPRYRPLTPADLKGFLVTVTIVQGRAPIEASNLDSLRREDGLVLQSGDRFGIVLPWEGSDPCVRLNWAYRKAGVSQGIPCRLFRLKADRFRG